MEKAKRYMLFLLVMAGCGGMLFDFGGTIIGPALPYIGPVEDNPGSLGLFTTAQVSHLSSAVVMCAAIACGVRLARELWRFWAKDSSRGIGSGRRFGGSQLQGAQFHKSGSELL